MYKGSGADDGRADGRGGQPGGRACCGRVATWFSFFVVALKLGPVAMPPGFVLTLVDAHEKLTSTDIFSMNAAGILTLSVPFAHD